MRWEDAVTVDSGWFMNGIAVEVPAIIQHASTQRILRQLV
jgi:hypothetical protein